VKRLVLFLLLGLPLALAADENVPQLPGFYWGEVNAACPLTTLAPDISVRFDFNGTTITTLPLSVEGNNLFRFGGPSASDSKAVIDCSAYPDFNVVLYVNPNASYVLGSVTCSSGDVKSLHYDINADQCRAVFPASKYTVNAALQSDCNGSFSNTTLYVYYGDTKLYSSSLSGTTSTSKSVTISGYDNNIVEGHSIVFKICGPNGCQTYSHSFHYGESNTIDFGTIPCSTLFAPPPETNMAQETNSTAEGAGTATTPESNISTTSSGATEPKTITSNTPAKSSNSGSAPTTSNSSHSSEANVNVPVSAPPKKSELFGVPLDQAIVIAIVVIIAIVVVVRFFL
jgi:hypothetical protein